MKTTNGSTKTITNSTINTSILITPTGKRRGRLHQKVRKIRYWQALSLIHQVSWKQRLISLWLIFSIFSTSVFASPDASHSVVVSFGEFKNDIRFGLANINFGDSLFSSTYAFFFKTFGKRQQSVERVVILPADENGKLTVMQGEKVNFTAIGFAKGEPLSGLNFKWSATDIGRKSPPRTFNNGNFTAYAPGTFLITAETNGGQAQVSLAVNPNEGYGLQNLLSDEVNPSEQSKTKETPEQKLARKNDLKGKKFLVSRDVSTKTEYQFDEEERLLQEDKQKRKEVEIKQEQFRKQPGNLNQKPIAESKPQPEGVDRAEAEGMYDENNIASETSTEVVHYEPKMMRPLDEDGWGGGNWWTADDPGNQTGNPPGTSPDAGAGNGNFQFSAPVAALPGRGIDVNLSLNYNSRLWSKSGNQISYDSDKGSPAPGWNLGFGKMIYMGSNGGCLLVDADGTRRGYAGTNSTYSSGTYYSNNFTGYTTDGSFIDYGCYYYSASWGSGLSGWANLPNGVKVTYYSSSITNDQIFPTQITDTQGNYITITYQNNRGPNINTVTDTMGRVITFNYDGANRLVSVSVPGYEGGPARTAVRIHYKQLNLNYAFAGGIYPDTATNSPWVIDAIYYPGTNTGYWFNDGDSYSSYGMIAKVIESRGMTWSGSGNNDQGSMTAGTMSKQAVYNYPLTPNGSLTDAPTYTSLTESWAGMDTAPAVTNYEINNNDYHWDGSSNSPCYTTKVIQPNGAISKQYAYRTPGNWTDGLIFADETLKSVSGVETVISSSIVSWQQGNYNSARPAFMTVTDERQNTLRTEMIYGANYNQLTSKKEYNYNNGPLLRETRTNYENSIYPAYHIFNLVKSNEVYDGAGNRVAKTDYEYDNNALNGGSHNLKATPGVVMHNYWADPYTTQTQNGPTCVQEEWQWVYNGYDWVQEPYCVAWEQVSAYDPNTIFRGNVTKVTNYADAGGAGQAIIDTKQYDVTGNLVAETASCCQLKIYDYTINTQYAYPTAASRGSSDLNSPIRNFTAASYDYNTGLVRTTTDANGRTDTNNYDANTLRPTTSVSSTNAYKTMWYSDDGMVLSESLYDAGNIRQGYKATWLNGMGKVVQTQVITQNPPNDQNPANWILTNTKYNNLGQVWQTTLPYTPGVNGQQWTTYEYDILGRTNKVTGPDLSVAENFYNEAFRPDSASNLPGETMRTVDAWGRERWSRNDALGRLVEVVEPNPLGNGTLAAGGTVMTQYTYNTMGNLTQTNQGAQVRMFWYDSVGRIVRQKLAEQNGSLTYNGQFVGGDAGGWSEVFVYDDKNLIQRIDARGVKTNYVYNNDPLNRLQSVSYDKSGAYNPNTIPDASPIYLSYVTSGDQDRISAVQTWWTYETNSYDNEGRVSDYTLSFPSGQPLTTSYAYDSLNRVTEIRYPAQYGMAGNPRKLVTANYDVASRMTELKVDNQIQMNEILYNPRSQVESIKIGAGTGNADIEQYSYDQQTGLLTNQKVKKANNNQMLLDISYGYDRLWGNGTLNGKTGQASSITNNLDANKNRVYLYDALGRLKFVHGGANNNWTQAYTYDRYGNRTNVAATGNTANNQPVPTDGLANLSYDQATNRINTAGYEYDLAGNLTKGQDSSGQWQRYEYDVANRLVGVFDSANNHRLGNGYTSSNKRLVTNEPGIALTWYVWGGDSVIAEYTSAGWTNPLSWKKSYVFAGDSLLSTYTTNNSGGETLEFHHPDRLGTKLVTNPQNDNLNFEQSTLPFGTTLTAENVGTSTTSRKFTSYDRSANTGLDYAVNRTYSSAQGRFTQVDPIGMSAASLGDPQSLNMYSYCGNDPINRTDPSGLFFGKLFRFLFKLVKIIVAVVMAVAAVLAISLGQVQLGIQLAVGSASIFAEVSGNKTFQNIVKWIGVGISAYQIYNRPVAATPPIFFKGGSSGGGVSRFLKILPGVGAILNFLAQKKNNETIRQTKDNVLKRLANKKCLDAINYGGYDLSPAEALKTVFDRENIKFMKGLKAPAQAPVGQTDTGFIDLGSSFFDKTIIDGYGNNWNKITGLNTLRLREFIILHELRHLYGSDHYDDKGLREDITKILKDCFGVTFDFKGKIKP